MEVGVEARDEIDSRGVGTPEVLDELSEKASSIIILCTGTSVIGVSQSSLCPVFVYENSGSLLYGMAACFI